jgi:hypothetical protein
MEQPLRTALLAVALAAPGAACASAPAAPPPAPASDARVSGPVLFPGCQAPGDLEVCAARDVEAAPVACVRPRLEDGALRYALTVPPGDYVVFARSEVVQPGLRAFYSRAVTCGLQAACRDHRAIRLRLAAGEARSEVAPADWFAPAGSPAVAQADLRPRAPGP